MRSRKTSTNKSEEAASDGGYLLMKGNLKDIVSFMTTSQDLRVSEDAH